MTTINDCEFEGVTTFPSSPTASYRFLIKVADNKLSIWLEDRKTKKQWESDKLAKEEFIPKDGAIPHASLQDYAKCFQTSLNNYHKSEAADHQPDLRRLEKGQLSLDLSLQTMVFQSVWISKYAFVMKPIAIETIDILTSKMRDQEEELADLRERFGSKIKKEDQDQPVFLEIQATATNSRGGGIKWSKLDSKYFRVSTDGEKIHFLVSGWYMIHVVLISGSCNYGGYNSSSTYELRKNEKPIKSCSSDSHNNCRNLPPLVCIQRIKANEAIDVHMSNGSVTAESYLVAAMLK